MDNNNNDNTSQTNSKKDDDPNHERYSPFYKGTPGKRRESQPLPHAGRHNKFHLPPQFQIYQDPIPKMPADIIQDLDPNYQEPNPHDHPRFYEHQGLDRHVPASTMFSSPVPIWQLPSTSSQSSSNAEQMPVANRGIMSRSYGPHDPNDFLRQLHAQTWDEQYGNVIATQRQPTDTLVEDPEREGHLLPLPFDKPPNPRMRPMRVIWNPVAFGFDSPTERAYLPWEMPTEHHYIGNETQEFLERRLYPSPLREDEKLIKFQADGTMPGYNFDAISNYEEYSQVLGPYEVMTGSIPLRKVCGESEKNLKKLLLPLFLFQECSVLVIPPGSRLTSSTKISPTMSQLYMLPQMYYRPRHNLDVSQILSMHCQPVGGLEVNRRIWGIYRIQPGYIWANEKCLMVEETMHVITMKIPMPMFMILIYMADLGAIPRNFDDFDRSIPPNVLQMEPCLTEQMEQYAAALLSNDHYNHMLQLRIPDMANNLGGQNNVTPEHWTRCFVQYFYQPFRRALAERLQYPQTGPIDDVQIAELFSHLLYYKNNQKWSGPISPPTLLRE